MVKEDFKEITDYYLITAKDLVKDKGDCRNIDCNACPFNRANTTKYYCIHYCDEELAEISKKFVENFGDK